MKYYFNKNYFDIIDNSEKAYWLGFIWADGYVCKRERKGNYIEYDFKLSLSRIDTDHLEKFKKCLNSNHNILFYRKNTSSFCPQNEEARLSICNKYFGEILYEKYGISPFRTDFSKIIEQVPEKFYIDLIRGLFDGDGSFSKYKWNNYQKLNVIFGGTESVLRFIENQISPNSTHKLYHRHKQGDKEWRTLNYSGVQQGLKILKLLYENSSIYLNRKYQKYLEYKQQ